jgi:hypothetical protein
VHSVEALLAPPERQTRLQAIPASERIDDADELPTATTMAIAAPPTDPVDLGEAFLAWLRAGLASGEFPINTVNARVHRVKEGVLLVSPGIFRDFGNAANAPWTSVQKRFQKLRLHRKTHEGHNTGTTRSSARRTRALKGDYCR